MPKILVTGTSSGFGLATAQAFVRAGWDVVATMRNPRPELLPNAERLKVLTLDCWFQLECNAARKSTCIAVQEPIDVGRTSLSASETPGTCAACHSVGHTGSGSPDC